jgi:hypothetical protein
MGRFRKLNRADVYIKTLIVARGGPDRPTQPIRKCNFRL